MKSLIRRKEPSEKKEGPGALSAKLSFIPVVLYCVGGVIGAGIFGTPGEIMRSHTGPAVVFSYIVAGLACGITASCYADFASRFPSAGGSYAYVYASLGEFCAWIAAIGNTFEYALSGAAVARLWSKSLIELVPFLAKLTFDFGKDAVFAPDLFAPLICFLMMCVCLLGVQTSTKFSAGLTVLNVSIIAFILIYGGVKKVEAKNYDGIFAVSLANIFRGASTAVFSFIGWDSGCVLSEEVQNPTKTIPKVLYTALSILTVIFSAMVFVLSGMVTKDSVSRETAFMTAFNGDTFARTLIGVVILLCCTNGTYACTQAQPRVWLSVARDGLLPKKFYFLSEDTATPKFSIIITGLLMITVSCLFDFKLVEAATTASFLLVQALVCLGCLVMRGEQMGGHGNKKVAISRWLAILAGICSLIGAAFFVVTGDNSDEQWKNTCSTAMLPFFILAALAAFVSGIVSPAKKRDVIIPLIALLVNFFLVGIAGFLQLGILVGIVAAFSIIYFTYGIRHSTLNFDQVSASNK